jgi:hypothetical protein
MILFRSSRHSLTIPINATFKSYPDQESTNISIFEIGEISNETSKINPLLLLVIKKALPLSKRFQMAFRSEFNF